MTQRKVIVHVGAPKTGTSYVQDLLFTHRAALADAGTLYPADRFDAHFLAALDLMELQWGGLEKQAVGAWDRLAEQVRAWSGTVIISHEILATATPAQVQRAFESFGDDTEVHVLVSARDLVRQVPAEWQENVKHRRIVGYRDYLDKITDPGREGTLAAWFWGVQEVPDILERWGGTLPPEQVHVVTVPPPDAPRGLLWERFAQVFGLDAATYATETGRHNPSLGVPETALIRRINERVNNGVLANEDYRQFVRELLAHQRLSAAGRDAPADPALPTSAPGPRALGDVDRRARRRRGTTSSAPSRTCGPPTRRTTSPSPTRTPPTRSPSPRPRWTRSSRCSRRPPGCRPSSTRCARRCMRPSASSTTRAGCGSGSSGSWSARPTRAA